MRKKTMAILAAFALVCAFTVNAGAQTMLTDDVAFVKLGYSMYTAKTNELTDPGGNTDTSPPDLEGQGFNVQGEYNMNLGSILLGFGLEYTYMPTEFESQDDYDD